MLSNNDNNDGIYYKVHYHDKEKLNELQSWAENNKGLLTSEIVKKIKNPFNIKRRDAKSAAEVRREVGKKNKELILNAIAKIKAEGNKATVEDVCSITGFGITTVQKYF